MWDRIQRWVDREFREGYSQLAPLALQYPFVRDPGPPRFHRSCDAGCGGYTRNHCGFCGLSICADCFARGSQCMCEPDRAVRRRGSVPGGNKDKGRGNDKDEKESMTIGIGREDIQQKAPT